MGRINKNRREILANRKRLIRNTAYQLWEEDGKPGFWFGDKIDSYESKAIEKLGSAKQVMIFAFSLLIQRRLYRIASLLLQEYGFLDHFITTRKRPKKTLAFLKSPLFLGIVGLLQTITIVIGVITFIATEKQRRNAKIYQAWQVITTAHNQPGSGGRKEALEFLNSEPRRVPLLWRTWPKQSLVNLSAPNAYLYEVNLQQAELFDAYLQQAKLFGANLQQADLRNANLQGANLQGANLLNANLLNTNLQQAYLGSSILQQAILEQVNLQEANLFAANLQGAVLQQSNLLSANLLNANLQNANLLNANLQNANLLNTNLQGANLQGADLNRAKLWNTNLQNANLLNTNLQGADLNRSNLLNANLQQANLQGAINLKPKQIKSACFWDKAIYKSKLDSEKKTLVIIEPDNTKFIEELKKNKSSNPINLPNCSYWN